MARNPRGGDGSAPPHGELISEASGGRPRTPRGGNRAAGITLDGTNSDEMRAHNDAAREAQRLHNSGASDVGGPVSDPGGLPGGGTSKPQAGRTGSSDPSSPSG